MSLQFKSLKDLIKVHYGKSLKQSDRIESGKWPVYGSSGQVGNHTATLTKEPTIIIGRKGSVGEITFAPQGGWTIDTAFYTEILDPTSLDLRYLFYALKKARLVSHTITTSIPGINRDNIYRTKIPLPPLAEQKRIAAILDKADAIRRKRQRAIKLADDFLRATFLDMFGDPVTNPKGWEVKEFEEIVADTKLGLVRSSKEFGWEFDTPYVRMDALTIDGKFLPEKVQNTYANKIEIESYSLRPGDFLFNTRNSKELVGKVCVFPGPEGWLFNNNLMRIRFCKGIESTFIAAQFQFQHIKRELEKRKSGTTSVFAIYWKSLRSLPVLVPSTNVQQRYASIVNSVERYLMRAINYGHESTNLFNSLTQRAFRGEL